MLTRVMPADAQPACTSELPLVDAAFEKPGGPDGRRLARDFCRRCPVATDCLHLAMANGEPGPWAGTTPKARTRAGGRPTRSPGGAIANLQGINHGSTHRQGRDRYGKTA